MRTNASTFLLLLLGMTSSLEARRRRSVRNCNEEDVCSAIVFNQLALAALKEEMGQLVNTLNDTGTSRGYGGGEDLDNCLERNKLLEKNLENLKKTQMLNDEEVDQDVVEELNLALADLRKTNEEMKEVIRRHQYDEDSDEVVGGNTNIDNVRYNEVVNQRNKYHKDLEDLKKAKEDLDNEKRRLEVVVKEQKKKLMKFHISNSKPADCADIQIQGQTDTGVYSIYPYQTEESVEVLCDLESNGGGWTVFFTRQPQAEPVDFNESWEHFKKGFGDVNNEYWLGNDVVHVLTSLGPSTLRIDAENFSGERRWAEWDNFAVGSEDSKYELIADQYKTASTMGDSLSAQSKMSFTTYDNDNDDQPDMNCALGSQYTPLGKGGWWYSTCGYSRLTAPLKNTGYWNSASWGSWDTAVSEITSLKTLAMKFRRHNYKEFAVELA